MHSGLSVHGTGAMGQEGARGRKQYRQAELLKGRLHKSGVLGQDLLQVPPAMHIPQNCSGDRMRSALCRLVANPTRPPSQSPSSHPSETA